MSDNSGTSQPTCGNCTDYIQCQTEFINSINHLNNVYYKTLNVYNIKDNTQTITTARENLNEAVNTMLTNADDLQKFMNCNKSIVDDYDLNYNDILKKRQDLNNKMDILKSINGAPKSYNTPDNIYDEYKINYNTSIYVSMMASILAVILIYIYFRNL
jgi:hypothetical protein